MRQPAAGAGQVSPADFFEAKKRVQQKRPSESEAITGPRPAAGARARDSGGAIAPATIHTYRKATAFGRIAAESPQEAHGRFPRTWSGKPGFSIPCAEWKNAPKFSGFAVKKF
jgi:hypothetical protein